MGLAPSATRIPTRAPSRHRAERMMGTVISLVAPDGGADGAAANDAFAWFHEVDRRFSPYRPDSEVSALVRAKLAPGAVSTDLAEVLHLADVVRALSDGAFDIGGHRPDGAPDPTGLVKGWSVDRAARILTGAGMERFAIDAGGDVLAHGGRAPESPWRVGVADPADRSSLHLVLVADELAVATSGVAERGRHIRDGRNGDAAEGLSSVTVVGHSLARADAYATAAFVMGEGAPSWLEALPGYEGVVVGRDGATSVTDGLGRYLAATAAA